jgi:hypothetical protein
MAERLRDHHGALPESGTARALGSLCRVGRQPCAGFRLEWAGIGATRAGSGTPRGAGMRVASRRVIPAREEPCTTLGVRAPRRRSSTTPAAVKP